MDTSALEEFCDSRWHDSVISELTEYIRIPNKSPLFDAEWEQNGYMDEAVSQFEKWALAQNIEGLELEIVRLPGRTPLMYMEIPGASDDTVLLYGHLDKQPEMDGWRDDLGPWKPVLRENKLYGRGGADDGYAMFASLIAIQALQKQKLPHARCVIIIEACEESGSFDLPFYIDALADRIGNPDLVICLDSGCGNYDQLWCTTSLRGLIGGELSVRILDEGVHSGDASGIVPSSFRILRQLLNRIDDMRSGIVQDAAFNVDIPEQRCQQAKLAAAVLNKQTYTKFPFTTCAQPASNDPYELILNRTWRPALSITGMDGLPAMDNAGNVLRPMTAVKLSLRLPPTCDAAVATKRLKTLLEDEPPYGAEIHFNPDWDASGWHAPPMEAWLENTINQSSHKHFGAPAVHMGEGGSIPFMGMLGEKFPQAQFLITGVLGPHSNAHGPNEFLHIPTAMKLTRCVSEIISKHYEQKQG